MTRLTAERLMQIEYQVKHGTEIAGLNMGLAKELLAEVEHLQAELKATQIEGGKYFATLSTAASRINALQAEVADKDAKLAAIRRVLDRPIESTQMRRWAKQLDDIQAIVSDDAPHPGEVD